MGLIFRNDDVSENTNFKQLYELYSVIESFAPMSEIWSCVTVLSHSAPSGAVYPSLPLKTKPFEYFLDVNQAIANPHMIPAKVVSHGLWHFDHTKIERELMAASIVSSCKLLYTDTFVPPFNKWSEAMSDVCRYHGIRLVKSNEEGWKSFEFNEFDPSHELWYFHSWKWTPEKLRDYLAHGYANARMRA